MKVKVAKSIDFEEVPNYVSEMINQIKEEFHECVKNTTVLSVTINEEEGQLVSLALLEKIRQKVIDIDLLLRDSSEILSGYMQTIITMKEEELERQINDTAARASEYIAKSEEISSVLEDPSSDKEVSIPHGAVVVREIDES